MKQRYIIVLSVCISSLLSGVLTATHYHWGSSNGAGVWNGNVIGGSAAGKITDRNQSFFTSETLSTSPDGSTTATQWGIFIPQPSDTLTLTDTVKIQGDVEIKFTGNHPATTYEYFEVNIGLPPVGGVPVVSPAVTVQAYNDSSTVISDGAQLIFNPAQGKVIIVNVYTDIKFVSADALPGNDPEDPESTGAALPLYVTFRGKGSTVFRLPSGRTLYFGPPNPGVAAEGGGAASSPLSTTGVRVQVYMEQGYVDAYGTSDGTVAPQAQLVFEKWSYDYDDPTPSHCVNSDLSLHTWITFGQMSSLSYLSDNYIGLFESGNDANNNGTLDVGEQTFETGYGSVAFDPSNKGTGRMILQIMRGQLPSGNDYTDAGINIYGALLAPEVWGSSRAPASIFNSNFRTGVYFNQRGGINAILRINDDVSFYERTGVAGDIDISGGFTSWINRPLSDRRGLVVINHNNSIPHFANNYDNALRIDESLWAQYNDAEPGFILGINGLMEIRPHMFLDYIANNDNKSIGAQNANLSVYTSDIVKKHNPAALYADGLPSFGRRSKQRNDQFGVPISDILYAGNSQLFGSHAVIALQGNAGVFVRAAAAYDDQALTRLLYVQPATNETYFLQPLPSDSSQVITVALGIGQYDGISIPVLDELGNPTMQSTSLDGSYAFDVEAPCTITSLTGPLGEPASGFFCVPSVEIDHAGREIRYDNFDEWSAWQAWYATAGPSSYASTTITSPSGATYTFEGSTPLELTQSPVPTRPLDLNHYYTVYDISTVFLNSNLILDSTTWVQSDVTRSLVVPGILPQPFKRATPHVVGGELASIRQELYPPLIKLYNSTIACHESVVMTGVALTVHEYPGVSGVNANNSSSLVCLNRGRDFDVSGYGRVIQFGSQANVAADGVTTSLLMSSAYLDVYRSAPTHGATEEQLTTIECIIRSTGERTPNGIQVVSDFERALHLVYLANASQIHLGWPTVEGDSGYVPATLDSVILEQLQQSDPANKLGFRFSPSATGVGSLQFSGGPFCIGAGDSVEALPPDKPIPGSDVDGVVYVNYGGKLSLAGTTDLYIDTVVARLKASDPTMTGSIVAPYDQWYELSNGSIQDYNIDFASDQNQSGNIDMKIDDGVHVFDVPQILETSDANFDKGEN